MCAQPVGGVCEGGLLVAADAWNGNELAGDGMCGGGEMGRWGDGGREGRGEEETCVETGVEIGKEVLRRRETFYGRCYERERE